MVTVDSFDSDKPLFVGISVFWDITLYSLVIADASEERVTFVFGAEE
jgi:hypothetical protein